MVSHLEDGLLPSTEDSLVGARHPSFVVGEPAGGGKEVSFPEVGSSACQRTLGESPTPPRAGSFSNLYNKLKAGWPMLAQVSPGCVNITHFERITYSTTPTHPALFAFLAST